jgi:anti-sigma factor RsiW
MKECWSEGDLRAYLDRELAPEEMERATAHLAECSTCSELYETISARAATVSGWMDELAPLPAAAVMPRRMWAGWKWVASALAAAAAIILAIVLSPHRAQPQPARPQIAPATAVLEPLPVEPTVQQAAVRPRQVRRPALRRPVEHTETFVALDNEPFEAGWVVRMALGPDQIQADVVFSADGRARAYRLVGNSSN